MKQLIVLFALTALLCGCASGWEFDARIEPAEIEPGDAFLIRIEGRNKGKPKALSASLGISKFRFIKTGPDSYTGIGAVDVETKPGDYVLAVKSGEDRLDVTVSVKSVEFREVKITLPKGKVDLSPEDEERTDIEAARMKHLWKNVSNKMWKGKFIKPVDNDLSTEYGAKRIFNEKRVSFHRGIDIRGATGTKIKASNRGGVIVVEELFYGGNTVILDHGLQVFTVYMHMSKFNVKIGDVVEKGDIVGEIGATGRATGPHLHFGVKVGDVSVNPEKFFELAL